MNCFIERLKTMTTDYYMPYVEVPKAYPTPLEMVKEYYKTAGVTPEPRVTLKFVEEELDEWDFEVALQSKEASKHFGQDYSEEAEFKEYLDVLFTLYGYGNSRGWGVDEGFYRVYQNNLGRMKQPDGTIKRDSNGKVLKNLEYPKVDLSDLVK